MEVKLVMFKPNGQRRDFDVKKPLTIIGRGENCDLRIPLVSISRRHAEVAFTGAALKVKDLASSNGTYVNGKRINECALKAGDRLVVGSIVFTVQVNGEPEQIAPVAARRGKKTAEEVVELEADVATRQEPEDLLSDASQGTEDDLDPISALEALAGDSKKVKKK
jgi:pSer/pThr/pTyr-binding forkhead associated (FHA) protein